MTGYELYTFILCLVVFVLLTSVSWFFIATITKQSIRLIKHGAEDEKITKEYEKSLKKKKSVLDCLFSFVMCVVLIAVFIFSLFVGCRTDTYSSDTPTFRVVQTGSMEKKHKDNDYLIKNNLNNQISTFDLIIVHKAPKEEDLKLYDIVVYEVDDIMIVHRIVEIEEPNQYHPEERWFKLQGDAVGSPDRFPVKYEQIKGIYKGQRVPFVGSFILFMQSPAGWLCIILVVGAMIITPIIEKKLNKAKRDRLIAIGVIVLEIDKPKGIVEETLPVEPVVEEVVEPVVEEVPEQPEVDPFERLRGLEKGEPTTFSEDLADLSGNVIVYYSLLKTKLERIKDLRMTDGKVRTYKCKSVNIAKFVVRGKTLNLYLGLNPEEYKDTKYVFTDASNVKKYQNFPMRMKITSDRQTSNAMELIDDVIEKNNLKTIKREDL